MHPLVDWPCSSGRPNIQDYMGAAQVGLNSLKKNSTLNWVGRKVGVDLGGAGGG